MKQVVLITGGSRGIGAACARLCARQGWAVAVTYRQRADAAEALVAQLRAEGADAMAAQADVAQEDQVLRLFEAVDRQWGRLDALVHSAGVVDRMCRLEDMALPRLRRMVDTNLLGSLLCCREAVRRMSRVRGGDGGSIVMLGSAAARLGAPGQYVDYAATKGALESLTLGLAREVAAEGIRVNTVRPGIIDTDIHADAGDPGRAARVASSLPMQRAGTAQEVANAIVWLLSPQASYTTGAILDVTGGR